MLLPNPMLDSHRCRVNSALPPRRVSAASTFQASRDSLPQAGGWRCMKTLAGHSSWVRTVAVSPDGRYLASGSGDKTVALWTFPEGKQIARLTDHTAWVRCIAFSPDSKLLASATNDNTIRLWEVATGNLVDV